MLKCCWRKRWIQHHLVRSNHGWIYAHLPVDPFMISWSVFRDPITQINDSYRVIFNWQWVLWFCIDERLISAYDEFILMIQEHESWFHNWSSRCPFIPRSMILWWDLKEWWKWVRKTINSFHWSSISIHLFIYIFPFVYLFI